jgi:dipeptidyl aminopeptidase/acylaminoacyl peptidase
MSLTTWTVPRLSDDRAVHELLSLPRIEDLAVAPGGSCAYAIAKRLSPAGDGLVGTLWRIELDGSGRAAPQPLAEQLDVLGPLTVLDDGAVVTLAKARSPEPAEAAALWLIPRGEAAPVAVLQATGGIEGFSVSPAGGAAVVALAVLPDVEGVVESERRIALARSRGGDARHFTSYPVRRWNRWIGPLHRRLFALEDIRVATALDALAPIPLGPPERLDDRRFALTPDGRTLVAVRAREPDERLQVPDEIVSLDLASGEERTLAAGPYEYGELAVSPDGAQAVAVRTSLRSPACPTDATLCVVDLRTGEDRDLTPDFEHWPAQPAWAGDGEHVVFSAWVEGRRPLFRVPTRGGSGTAARRVTGDGDFVSPRVRPGSDEILAIHSTPVDPPALVVVRPGAAPARIVAPPAPEQLRARLEEVTVTVDGTPVRSSLILPERAAGTPLPLLVNIHGGPHECFSGWLWSLNAAVFAHAGFAVLQPDPGGTPGYGQAFVREAWGGTETVEHELLTVIDRVSERTDVDADRIALLGASFGGQMVNRLLGRTDRFKAAVSHAGIWDRVQYQATSDMGRTYSLQQFGDALVDPAPLRAISALPLRGAYTTPLLITHGEKDYRVPIDQALEAWSALQARGAPGELLVFPQEDHHVNHPANQATWYETVLAFLARHV